MMDKKQQKQAPWLLQAIVIGFVTWVFTILTPLLVFLGTGVVNLSHTGWGPFLIALVVSLLLTFVGFVLGVRVTLYYVLTAIAGLWLGVKYAWTHFTTHGLKLTPPDPATLPALPAPPTEPEPPDNSLRTRMGEAGVRFLIWFFVPKHVRALWEGDDD